MQQTDKFQNRHATDQIITKKTSVGIIEAPPPSLGVLIHAFQHTEANVWVHLYVGKHLEGGAEVTPSLRAKRLGRSGLHLPMKKKDGSRSNQTDCFCLLRFYVCTSMNIQRLHKFEFSWFAPKQD